MVSKVNCAFVPDWNKDNPYLNLLKQNFSPNVEVKMLPIPRCLRPFSTLKKNNPELDVIHIHWITELIQMLSWSKAWSVFFAKLLVVIYDVYSVRRKGVKVVWTIHNKYAHKGFDKKRERLFRTMLAWAVNETILHSEQAVKELKSIYGEKFPYKVNVIPHGNYFNCYPDPTAERSELKRRLNVPPEHILVLYFGAVRPYKGVERLITSFQSANADKNKTLIVAGNAPDKNYRDSLEKIIEKQPDQIVMDLNYIEDQDLVDYLSIADVVVLPFTDTLTSGSAILSMTMGKALLLPENAKVFGCVPDAGAQYFSDEKMLQTLLQQLDSHALKTMGAANEKAAKTLDWRSICQKIESLYRA